MSTTTSTFLAVTQNLARYQAMLSARTGQHSQGKQAVDRKPDYVQAHHALGNLAQEQSDFAKAAERSAAPGRSVWRSDQGTARQ